MTPTHGTPSAGRTPGLYTDPRLATRKMPFQRLLLGAHRWSARHWSRRAAAAPAIADLMQLCRERMPPDAVEYYRGGAGEETSSQRNRAAFREVNLNPSVAVRFDAVDMTTTLLGTRTSMPVIVAPVGSLRTGWPEGEAVAAEAASRAGVMFALSTLTGTRMERVKEVAPGPCWFQLYLVGGREVAERGIARARAAGYEALILTIDTAVAGNRLGDKRNRSAQLIGEISAANQSRSGMVGRFFRGLYRERMRQALQLRTWKHFGWMLGFLADGQLMDFPNIELVPGTPMGYMPIGKQLAQSAVTWQDLGWIRAAWGDRPIIIKGVHNIDDARRAEQEGAAAIVVSNHGGRQVDGTPATLHMLQEIVPQLRAAGSRMEVYLDGGIRTGADVVVARACGAKAVLLGTAIAFSLGAGGPAGVARCLEIFRQEIEDTLRLLGKGRGSIDDIDESIFYRFHHRIT